FVETRRDERGVGVELVCDGAIGLHHDDAVDAALTVEECLDRTGNLGIDFDRR
ncbi:MAG: hypothetical protein QOF01_4511, partial [Thermomicrobiales bacterium]|nr:hypothetical protein [Thermomicrobiales bacterium]